MTQKVYEQTHVAHAAGNLVRDREMLKEEKLHYPEGDASHILGPWEAASEMKLWVQEMREAGLHREVEL